MTEGVDYGLRYVCFICGQYYEDKKSAIQCSVSHEELLFEPVWKIGCGDLPVMVKVSKKIGTKVLKEMFYIRQE